MTQTTSDENSDNEEPNIPDIVTQSGLTAWVNARYKRTPPPANHPAVISDAHGLLRTSEQHQQGISVFMKRCRREIIKNFAKEPLARVPSSKLPRYLQDVQMFNVELLNRTKTREHRTLPTTKTIEEENGMIGAEGKTIWPIGPVIRENSMLVDSEWTKDQEEKYIMKSKRRKEEKDALILRGVSDCSETGKVRDRLSQTQSLAMSSQSSLFEPEEEVLSSASEQPENPSKEDRDEQYASDEISQV